MVLPMDKLKKRKPKKEESTAFVLENWAIEAGTIILGSLNLTQDLKRINQDKNFLKLPDINRAIISQSLHSCATARSLDEVAAAIRSLTHGNTQLNILINDPGFSLSLIKHYSLKLNLNNETVAKRINTEGTAKVLARQEKIMHPIRNQLMPDSYLIKEMRTSNFDLYFTNKDNYTPAVECLLNGNVDGLKMFLDAGVDPDLLLTDALWLKQNSLISHIDMIISMLVNAVHEKKNKEEHADERSR
jgi:hypothetical protein